MFLMPFASRMSPFMGLNKLPDNDMPSLVRFFFEEDISIQKMIILSFAKENYTLLSSWLFVWMTYFSQGMMKRKFFPLKLSLIPLLKSRTWDMLISLLG